MDGLEWNVVWSDVWDDIIRVGVAALLGGALGFEREWKGHWAGLRTHMMVAMGCAVFVVGAIEVAGNHQQDVTRVIQGIASGIGFLGAGTILKLDNRQEIKGLTTASSIWLAAALGTTAGLAHYALAIASTIVSLFILAGISPFEKFFEKRQAEIRKERDKTDRRKSDRKLENEEEENDSD